MTSERLPENRRGTTLFAVSLTLIFALGAALRVWYARLPVNPDEAYTFLTYARGSLLTALGKYNVPNNHVLNSVLISITRIFVGDSYLALRLPVFVFGLATILAGAWLLRPLARAGDRTVVGLGTAAFIAISARFVQTSVEARGYGIEAFFFLVSLAAAERLLRRRRHRDIFLFALASALGLLGVPTHLYAVASIGLWMLALALTEFRAEFKQTFDVIVRAHVRLAGLAAVAYFPVIVYVLINHTKIEAAEPLAQLFVSVPKRCGEFIALLSTEHSLVMTVWLAIGAAALFTIGRRAQPRATLLLISCVLGPLAVFIVTKRVAPFARVWTYLLPVLFALALTGWSTLIDFFQLSPRLRQKALVAVAALPLIAATVTSSRYLADGLAAREVFSAERAWEVAIRQLRSGDQIGFETEFHEQVRFLALTRVGGDFKYEPLTRRTEENVDVVEQNGRTALKVNPFDESKPGRALLYATSAADLGPMEKWLKPYLPARSKLRARALTGAEFPALYEFEAIKD